MRRVLLTGASGFVGRHALPHLLARGFEVHAVYHGNPGDWDLPSQGVLRTILPKPARSSVHQYL